MTIRHLLSICLMCCLAGCGGGGSDKAAKNRQKTVSASGSVKFNGKPVEGATVVFAPTTGEKAVAAMALTDSSGNFSLQAYPPLKGAVPGSYKVAISKMEAPPPAPTGPNAHDQPAPPPPKRYLPEKYSDAEKSGLRADIPESGRADLDFDLQ